MLDAGDAFWRPSNQMGVQNTDLAKQLEVATLGARLWRLVSGQASTRHRHFEQTELSTWCSTARAGCGSGTSC